MSGGVANAERAIRYATFVGRGYAIGLLFLVAIFAVGGFRNGGLWLIPFLIYAFRWESWKIDPQQGYLEMKRSLLGIPISKIRYRLSDFSHIELVARRLRIRHSAYSKGFVFEIVGNEKRVRLIEETSARTTRETLRNLKSQLPEGLKVRVTPSARRRL